MAPTTPPETGASTAGSPAVAASSWARPGVGDVDGRAVDEQRPGVDRADDAGAVAVGGEHVLAGREHRDHDARAGGGLGRPAAT